MLFKLLGETRHEHDGNAYHDVIAFSLQRKIERDDIAGQSIIIGDPLLFSPDRRS